MLDMLLLCVNNKPIPGTYSEQWALDLIKEGEYYDGYLYSAFNPDGKEKQGWRIPSVFKGCNNYDITRFVPVDPDLDETTLVNEEWEQKVCEPVNERL